MRKRETRDIVLVVDDSPETLRLLTEALEDAGMTVLVAREGEHALSIVEKVLPDVILMDALMPGTDGFETCRRLKQNKALIHVPVLFMTGLSDTEHIIEGLEAGGVDYVTKPIVPGELLARIRVHLANARIAHSARTALDAFGRFLLATSRTGGAHLRPQNSSAMPSAILTRRIMSCRMLPRSGCNNAWSPRRPSRLRHRRRSVSRQIRHRSNCS
jgi:DNA-binding response OmpR family regulator